MDEEEKSKFLNDIKDTITSALKPVEKEEVKEEVPNNIPVPEPPKLNEEIQKGEEVIEEEKKVKSFGQKFMEVLWR